MRFLQRDPASPQGLTRYQHGRDLWSSSSPNAQERQAIWDKLDAMQAHLCAYCEGPMDEGNRHIEHFRQRSRFPQGTFDWHNMFGSCNRSGTCGDHKDKCGSYPHHSLIKPDVDDPEYFLVFSPDGSVRPRASLTEAEQLRALETIRILALDGALRQIRRAAVAGYVKTAEAFAELAQDFPEEEWLPELQQEVQFTANLPYATAIKHVLTCQGS